MPLRYLPVAYLLTLLAILISFILQWPDGKLHLVACDVGQGDSYLVTKGFSQILVDAGKDARVLSCLEQKMPYWDRNLDVVIATHDDHDHVGGLPEILKRYRVNRIYWNGKPSSSADWVSIKQLSDEYAFDLRVGTGVSVRLGDLGLEPIWPSTRVAQGEEDNIYSLVTKLRYRDFSVLFTGDIDTVTEEKIISGSHALNSAVLKVSHHGSKQSTSDTWLEKVAPKVALIGVGKNSYGHPNPEVLDRLQRHKVQVYRTDEDGTVEIISDGNGWWVGEEQQPLFGRILAVLRM